MGGETKEGGKKKEGKKKKKRENERVHLFNNKQIIDYFILGILLGIKLPKFGF